MNRPKYLAKLAACASVLAMMGAVTNTIAAEGGCSTSNAINNGLNYWSFDTNFALTYLNPETGRDLSFNLGYIYNTENSDTGYQTGQKSLPAQEVAAGIRYDSLRINERQPLWLPLRH